MNVLIILKTNLYKIEAKTYIDITYKNSVYRLNTFNKK